jgi:hypothetical protein
LGFYHPKTKKKLRKNQGRRRRGEAARPTAGKKKNKQTVGLRRDLAKSGEASAGEIWQVSTSETLRCSFFLLFFSSFFLLLSLFFVL